MTNATLSKYGPVDVAGDNATKLYQVTFNYIINQDESSSVLVNVVILVFELIISMQYFTYLKFSVDPSIDINKIHNGNSTSN